MFIQSIEWENEDSLELFISNTIAESVLVEIFTPAIGDVDIESFSKRIDPLSSQIFLLPDTLKAVGTGRSNRGLVLQASGPVTVHGFATWTAACGGFMAIPTDRLGYDYVAAAYRSNSVTELGIVAADDNVQLAIVLPRQREVSVFFEGVTYSSSGRNVIENIVLAQHHTVQIQALDNGDLTGARVVAQGKVAVFSGNVETDVFFGTTDHVVEQLLPRGSMGTVYNLVPTPEDTTEGYYYKIISMESNNNIFIGGSNAAASAFLENLGDQYEGLITSPTQIRAEREIMVVQYTSGTASTDNPDRGDPTMFIVPPMQNYKNVFTFTVPVADLPSFRIHLLLTVPTEDLNTILINQELVPSSGWTSIPSPVNTFASTVVTLTLTDGYFRVYSVDPSVEFAAVVYGYGSEQCAFAYPAGMCLEYSLSVSWYPSVKSNFGIVFLCLASYVLSVFLSVSLSLSLSPLSLSLPLAILLSLFPRLSSVFTPLQRLYIVMFFSILL